MKVGDLPQTLSPILWFTGLSGAGKSTLAATVSQELDRLGIKHQVLDADTVRKHLCHDLGFSAEDRKENVRRLIYVARLLSSHGITTLVAAISPLYDMRSEARAAFEQFIEIFVDAPLQVCKERDPVGLYRRFDAGEIRNLSGIDSPYEAPINPEVHCRTDRETIQESAAKIIDVFLQSTATA